MLQQTRERQSLTNYVVIDGENLPLQPGWSTMATLQVITPTNSSYADAYMVVAGCPSDMKSYLLTDSYENVSK